MARKRYFPHAGTFCDNSQSWKMASVEGAKRLQLFVAGENLLQDAKERNVLRFVFDIDICFYKEMFPFVLAFSFGG